MKQLAAWYQKKISSYDKEEWETMVEQLLMCSTYRRRIVDFTTHSRSYLIDVDLVRGSSFPKAKPTLGMRRVVWFAVVRLLFLPLLYQWWAHQTSVGCAKFLLSLWLLQVFNIVWYCLAPTSADVDPNCWLVPLALMLILSVVHSEIVSTTEKELARVRPRSTYRRKLPRYFRRARPECDGDGGGSAESGATSSQSKTPSTKPFKFRRRLSRTDIPETGIRKRKKELTKENLMKNLDLPIKNKTVIKVKAKDSDDEDYMMWKKPDLNTPVVTFTPPPEQTSSGSSFAYKANSLTKKRLENFSKQIQNNGRTGLADGDDGFESLNGYNSNGSEGDNRSKDNEQNEQKNGDEKSKEISHSTSKSSNSCNADSVKEPQKRNVVKNVKPMKTEIIKVKKEDDEKSVDLESDGANNSPSQGKRAGVRFRKLWVQDNIQRETSDDDFANVEKKKKLENYQSSSSDGECSASAPSIALPSHHTMSDWVGQTTNSEESSYGSQSEGDQSDDIFHYTADSSWDPFAILDPTSDTVKCTMWEMGSTLRAELSAVDISWCVVARAERAMAAHGSSWPTLLMAAAVALVSPVATLIQVAMDQDRRSEEEMQSVSLAAYLPSLLYNYSQGSLCTLLTGAFGDNKWAVVSCAVSCWLRLCLSGVVFFLLSVAERAYKQRFLYAKLFSHLTSARRARKSELPHFRLNTVRNIKTWLSTRSYLRRRGPQRSVDVIVSAAFMLTLTLLACVALQLLKESVSVERAWLVEALVWCGCLGLFLLRLVALGSNVNRKYRACLSALLTEQINLHFAIEQRPHCKDQLNVANNVLKLAADLLKELDAPFRITGICGNNYLYTISKVVVLSALSGVLSEMLGFKLKLHKIKIK